MMLAAASFVFCVITVPATRYLTIIQIMLYHMAGAGVGQNMLNITYNFVDSKYFVQASAIKYSISGLCGFGASMLGSFILGAVQANGNTLFGVTIYGQQLLSAISLVIVLVGIVFVKLVMEKQKIIAK